VTPVVVLGISGSIAAYKAVELARLLIKRGARVRPIMTKAAERFVGPVTLQGICGEQVHSDMFARQIAGELHVELAASADVVALVPATADLLASLAHGRAGDVVRATALCASCPVLAAPAMHPRMWNHPAMQRNVAQLQADGRVQLVGPVDGEVASGDSGRGRMAEPQQIADAIFALMGSPRDLDGKNVVVTAGPTLEDIDPARFLSNRSSGKMGFAIAERAALRGARVTLVAGPVALATPAGVQRVDVRSALEMRDAMKRALEGADVLVMAAAVADYRPADPKVEKIKRAGQPTVSIELVQNPDLLAEVGAMRKGASPYLVGFALETVDAATIVGVARGKLERKKVDVIVANHADDAFDKDTNRATLVTATTADALGQLPKRVLADRILDHVSARLDAVGAGDG
jgi:phosphopantothenoylcysteine decarboxylase/phosphopantothenate--cysteine ligase